MKKPNYIADYLIVGAGSAGCVLANKLSENPENRVVLIEAGPTDNHPFIHMPKGIGKLLFNPRYVWQYPVDPGPEAKEEVWVRGRTLGGSSSVNGMIYNRGQAEDFDHLEELGCDGWNWATILDRYRAMEDHPLGANAWRGAGGPLRLSLPDRQDPLLNAMVEAGANSGLKIVDDVNGPHGEGVIGPATANIYKGSRQSSAKVFLEPVRSRRNLTVLADTRVENILFEGNRAAGVLCTGRHSGEWFGEREVILCAGGIASPQLLQVSGVGDASLLKNLGITVVSDLPEVGQNLREHRVLSMEFGLNSNISHNREYRGWRLVKNVLQYYASRRGKMAAATYDVAAFLRSRRESDRPDAQLLLAPYSLDPEARPIALAREPGMSVLGFILRPESKGELRITSRRMSDGPYLRPNYLSDEYDRKVALGIFEFVRSYVTQEPLKSLVESEIFPGINCNSEEEILDVWRNKGGCGYHLVGTCRMGSDSSAVVNPRLQVAGTRNLRVMDCSILPFMVAGNTNAPMMAMAAQAADLILEDNRH